MSKDKLRVSLLFQHRMTSFSLQDPLINHRATENLRHPPTKTTGFRGDMQNDGPARVIANFA